MDQSSSMPGRVAGDLFAGAGLGLLLGVVGLSGSPVVAVVVGSLTSLLAVFLGLDEKEGVAAKLPRVNAARIGAFGFVTVIGLGLGLHARVNNTFAEDPFYKLAKWQATFPDDPELVKQMVIFDHSGIEPKALTFGKGDTAKAIAVSADTSGIQKSVLFSTFSGYDACSRLNPKRLPNPSRMLAAYRRESTPELFAEIADQIEELPQEEWFSALSAAHIVMCAVQPSELRKGN